MDRRTGVDGSRRCLSDSALAPALWGASQDSPRFEHRGLLIDSSRNFLSLAAIQRVIDGLAATKMNVLHWHIVDSQSFPVEVAEFPRLTDAAYSTAEIYSPDDIAGIVQYAYDRGVRIMPEFGA